MTNAARWTGYAAALAAVGDRVARALARARRPSARGRAPPSGTPISTAKFRTRSCVWSKNSVGRPGKGVSVQAKLKSPKPTPNQGCEAISASAFDQIAVRELEKLSPRREASFAAEHVVALRGPERGQPPHQRIEHRRENEQHARAASTGDDRAGPTRPASACPSAPVASREDDDVDEGDHGRRARRDRQRLGLAEPDRGDDRPQQQAAQVVRLAQVAGRATGIAAMAIQLPSGRGARTPGRGR